MKVDLKNTIKNNKKLFYAALCFKNARNKDFVDKVIGIDHDYELVRLEKKSGKVNPSGIIYEIEVGSSTIGFFALMRLVLNALAYSDFYGLKPIVVFKPCVSYQEKELLFGTQNSFEYYFQQITDTGDRDTLEFIKDQKAVMKCIPEHYTQTFYMYGLPVVQDYLLEKQHYEFLAEIMHKYIRFQPHVEEELEKDIEKLGYDPSMISVHYRGTDFKNNYGSHPVSIEVDDYIDAIQKLPQEYSDKKIFLATDDKAALSKFQKTFGNRVVVYNDVQRADGNVSVICSESNRNNHHYQLGYEVIRDMYTLSKGSCLVAGLSQVSIFARLSKLSRNEKFDHEVVINKGVNHNSRSHVTDMQHERGKKK